MRSFTAGSENHRLLVLKYWKIRFPVFLWKSVVWALGT